MFCCTMVNHLGLIDAIENIIHKKLIVLNCSKCLTFWVSLVYLLFNLPVITSLSIAFALAFIATWFELILGLIDKMYDKIYSKNFASSNGTSSEN